MKLTIAKEQLTAALRRALNVSSTRTTLPILNNVLLETVDGKLVLTGTDLEVSIRTEVPATIDDPGSITVLAKKFGQIIGSLPDGDVILEIGENQQLAISCKKSFFKIISMDSAEYPRESQMENGWSFASTCGELRKSLEKVAYSTSPDETRRVLNGILMSLRGGLLTMAATDGRRLAMVEKALPDGVAGEGDVILPPKVVNELQKLGDDEKPVTVQLSDRRVAFKTADTLITSKLVDGNYPNYRQAIPGSFSQTVILPRQDFLTVLNRVSYQLAK